MQRIFWFLPVALIFLLQTPAKAQDPQFSQFYAAPLYINPAFTGSTQEARVGLNFRAQWPGLDASFTTAAAYFDYFWERYNSGVGIMLLQDQEGLAGLSSTTISLNYAYQVYINNSLVFRPGIQASFVTRNVDFDRLTFGTQFDPLTGQFNPNLPNGEPSGDRTSYFDLGLGGLLYGTNFWIGASFFHITEPNQAFFDDGTSGLPMKASFHAGYRFPLRVGPRLKPGEDQFGRERSITPAVQYKFQGEFDQLDLGLYATWEPIVLGLWYRGLPIDNSEGVSRNESIILLVGYTNQKMKIGYSFDYTLSSLGIQSGGAHEISISYQFPLAKYRYRPPRSVMQIPCPNF